MTCALILVLVMASGEAITTRVAPAACQTEVKHWVPDGSAVVAIHTITEQTP